MTALVGGVLDVAAGYGVFGICALILLFALYRMARHEILLFGSVVNTATADSANRYSFFVQNLEDSAFPGPINVRITDRRTQASDKDKPLVVNLFAGPKKVAAYSAVVKQSDGLWLREWQARFDDLPALDAWRLDCDTSSSSLELSIDTGDEITTVRPRLIKDISHRRLLLSSEQGSHSQYFGATVTPRMPTFAFIVLALMLAYFGAILVAGLTKGEADSVDLGLRLYDVYIACTVVVMLYLGFLFIRRPVYPIIQGYFFRTIAGTPIVEEPAAALKVDEANSPVVPASSRRPPPV
jgi:hypothetical protein